MSKLTSKEYRAISWYAQTNHLRLSLVSRPYAFFDTFEPNNDAPDGRRITELVAAYNASKRQEAHARRRVARQ